MLSWDMRAVYRWLSGVTYKEVSMKQLLRIFVAVFIFASILVGCMIELLLLILMVRSPPLLIAVVLACWIYRWLQSRIDQPSQWTT